VYRPEVGMVRLRYVYLSAPSAATQIDVVASGTATHIEAATFEVQKGTGTWALDTNGAQTTNGTSGTLGAITGPSITTTDQLTFAVVRFTQRRNTKRNA